ncbi:MAG: hypothetical protein ACFE9M_07885 [Promethearchaeota archaeon]
MKPRERLLKIFASIMFTSVVFVLVVTFIGVGYNNNFSENGAILPGMGTPVISDFSTLGDDGSGNDVSEDEYLEIELIPVSDNSNVLVAEIASEFCVDTEPGFMVVVYDIPDTLPLCITEEYLDLNFGITVMSYGGYHPEDGGMNVLGIAQPKTNIFGCVLIEWIYVGSFECMDPAMPCYGCMVDVYVADFVLCEPIQLDSNHLPDVYTFGADWATLCDGIPSEPLNKWVHLSFISSWEGCHEYDQKFKLILAHKSYFSEIPTSI